MGKYNLFSKYLTLILVLWLLFLPKFSSTLVTNWFTFGKSKLNQCNWVKRQTKEREVMGGNFNIFVYHNRATNKTKSSIMKRKNQNWIFFLSLSCIIMFACNRNLNSTTTKDNVEQSEMLPLKDRAEALAKERYKENYQIELNKTESAALVSQSIAPRSSSIFKTVYYFILDDTSNEIIYKDVVPNATVEWISNEEIQLVSIPGRGDKPGASDTKDGYIFNIKTKTKHPLNKK